MTGHQTLAEDLIRLYHAEADSALSPRMPDRKCPHCARKIRASGYKKHAAYCEILQRMKREEAATN